MRCEAGELPPDVRRPFDAYLITGSPAGVYEDLPWIAPLTTFLRAQRAGRSWSASASAIR